jgi:hypothetical protein
MPVYHGLDNSPAKFSFPDLQASPMPAFNLVMRDNTRGNTRTHTGQRPPQNGRKVMHVQNIYLPFSHNTIQLPNKAGIEQPPPVEAV